MLLVIDVGNTNTVIGIFDGDRLICNFRIRTERNATEDEFHILLKQLLADRQIGGQDLNKTIISCVVPPMMTILESFCRKYLNHAPFWVTAESIALLMPVKYDNPSEVGADRIVNALAAYHKYRTGLIVIDFGTATTFDVISPAGEYIGGAITPGIMISSEALFQRASKLPRVDLHEPPRQAIGRNTEDSMKSGIIFGYGALVDGMVARIQKELAAVPMVIATGGLAPLMAGVSSAIVRVESQLTLEGLLIIGNQCP